MKFLIVSEKSVKDIIPLTVASLKHFQPNCRIDLIVPNSDLDTFFKIFRDHDFVKIYDEKDFVDGFTKPVIQTALGPFGFRAGWYLQQLVKLNYARFTSCDKYIIWDSDTVQLNRLTFYNKGGIYLNRSKNLHPPYRKAIERIFGGIIPPAQESFVSQFMVIETFVANLMLDDIKNICGVDHWFEGVLKSIPLNGPSEFSEFETYASYAMFRFPDKYNINRSNWFLYGSDILGGREIRCLEEIQNIFPGFDYVSFERFHKKNFVKSLYAQLCLKLRISS